ncbi:hypothetical protein AZI86_05160 [Bdellovibrio bacteriovorus]|uniref:DUF5666 domain-containing protein n=1 Tax=Bdellovibrio bacteriovorus TaxID=959 RepID=A0A150WPX1_BDEBC|nr:hypothetical protein [Bdellovibrio bacteriovorus]KYG66438.1 hypothetical protein AZI86_05160 [Bdellovibrio bacteriovorus]
MKSVFISFVLLFVSFAVNAANEVDAKSVYMISTSIFMNGKLVSKPRITVSEGQVGTITETDSKKTHTTSLKVIATKSDIPNDPKAQGVLLNMDVYSKRDGEEIHSTPQMILKEGHPGSIEIAEDSGKNLKLEVVVSKVR